MAGPINEQVLLAPGLKADVNVIDLASLRILEPRFVRNLPGRFVKNEGEFKDTLRPSTLNLALTQLKWQVKIKALGVAALAKLLGANNLEAIGFYMQRNPRPPTTTSAL